MRKFHNSKMISSLRSIMNLATTPLRRHRWVLAGCVLLFVGYSVFSLRNDDPRGFFWSIFGHQYHHGWPWLYMIRDIPNSPPGPGWMHRVNLADGVLEFQWWSLLANFAVALGLSLGATCLWWLHCRQRKAWQVSLGEIMLVMLVFSLAAGGYMRTRTSYEEEVAYLESLQEQGWHHFLEIGDLPWYLQPLRDLGLIDPDDWWPHDLSWRGDGEINRTLSQQVATGRRLSSFAKFVTISDPECDDESLELLAQWMPYCEGVYLFEGPSISGNGIRRLGAGMPRIKSLSIDLRQADDEMLAAISQLKYLEDLEITQFGESATPPTSLAPLHQLKYLKSLELPEEWELSREDDVHFERQGVRVNEMQGVMCGYSFAP